MQALIAVVLFAGLLGASAAGCSSHSEIVGAGACEGFCNKWVGARCKKGPERQPCMEGGLNMRITESDVVGCLPAEQRCPDQADALLHCATLEGTIACETGSGNPKILGCDREKARLNVCLACEPFCTLWTTNDAGQPRCSRSTSRAACLAACESARCSQDTLAVRACVMSRSGGLITCDENGDPQLLECDGYLQGLRNCQRADGHGTVLFDWPPPPATAGDRP